MVFLVYAGVRTVFNLPSIEKPRQRSDTLVFIEISKQPLLSAGLWAGSRPPTFPLLLKLADRSLPIASSFQLTFSILSWGALALVISSFFRTPWLRLFSFVWILVLSLVPHLAGWDFTVLSESLSLSLFVLFVACGLWLMNGWSSGKAAALIVVAFFLAFVRDTNAYLLLILAVCLFIGVLLGWTKRRSLVLVAFFLAILLLSNISADRGGRWVFPLINIIGRRVLPVPRALNFLQSSCAMPVSAALMGMRNQFANGQVQAFYADPQLEGFRTWLLEHGKTCYPRLLMSDPVHSLFQPLEQFNELLAFRRVGSFLAHGYKPLVPALLEPLFYPSRFSLALWILLTLAAVLALILQIWKYNRLWAGFLLLCLSLFPHLFLTWHSEVMDPERHALSVGLQLALSTWILVFLMVDFVLEGRQEPAGAPSPSVPA
jgi:hypothetical protein